MTFAPKRELLDRYAEILVGWALGGGSGIAPGDVVSVAGRESAKPLYAAVCRAVWRAGGHVSHSYMPDDDDVANLARDYFTIADDAQIDFFPAKLRRGEATQMDHLVYLHSERDPRALEGVDARRMIRSAEARRPFNDWLDAKENDGRFSWTIGVYGTQAMADEAGLDLEEYWTQIIAACYLDEPDPVARWREIDAHLQQTCAALDALDIDRLHLTGEDVDLWLTLGERRKWVGGGGRNLPSFEIFTSPDWRGTEGWIRFSEPLYTNGSLVTGVRLRFEAGRVVEATAEENESLLREMIASDGADRIGEFSLTDGRLSRITRFMADTLFDENRGGRYGNTHLAVGRSYQTTYAGDPSKVSEEEWEQLGFNESAVHTDIVSTTDRTVTATLRDGTERVIYADGRFTLDPVR